MQSYSSPSGNVSSKLQCTRWVIKYTACPFLIFYVWILHVFIMTICPILFGVQFYANQQRVIQSSPAVATLKNRICLSTITGDHNQLIKPVTPRRRWGTPTDTSAATAPIDACPLQREALMASTGHPFLDIVLPRLTETKHSCMFIQQVARLDFVVQLRFLNFWQIRELKYQILKPPIRNYFTVKKSSNNLETL